MKKKHSLQKRLNRLARVALKHQGVIFVGGMGACNMVDLRHNKIYAPSINVAKSIEEVRAKWSVFCAVFCRGQDDEDYMKSVSIHIREARKQSELLESLNDIHQDLLTGCNSQHVINVGWIAMPNGEELTEEQAGAIFGDAGAWNVTAEWENEQLVD